MIEARSKERETAPNQLNDAGHGELFDLLRSDEYVAGAIGCESLRVEAGLDRRIVVRKIRRAVAGIGGDGPVVDTLRTAAAVKPASNRFPRMPR
jgi:hypothetical protein